MSDVEIVNPVPAEEISGWLLTLATTFLHDPHGTLHARWLEVLQRQWQPERAWGAYHRQRWVATLRTYPRRLTVPGGADLTVDALTNVTVNATHRRRGLLSAMLGASLAAARDRGDALSILVAAEWPIYGRFGYAPATNDAHYTFRSGLPGSVVTPADGGAVRQVDAAEFRLAAQPVFDRARAQRAGMLDRDGDWWDQVLGTNGVPRIAFGSLPNLYLHEGTDGPDGLLMWSPKDDFDIDGTLGAIEVSQLVAASDVAYRNLWSYLSGIDVVERISLRHRPVDEPVRWLLPDGRALRQDYSGDFVWLRILDVPAALSARGYAASDRLVIEVVDGDQGGFAAGTYLLDTTGPAAVCERTAETPELRVSQRALASAYLGAYSLTQLRAVGVEELATGTLARADAMFRTATPPWNPTGF